MKISSYTDTPQEKSSLICVNMNLVSIQKKMNIGYSDVTLKIKLEFKSLITELLLELPSYFIKQYMSTVNFYHELSRIKSPLLANTKHQEFYCVSHTKRKDLEDLG